MIASLNLFTVVSRLLFLAIVESVELSGMLGRWFGWSCWFYKLFDAMYVTFFEVVNLESSMFEEEVWGGLPVYWLPLHFV